MVAYEFYRRDQKGNTHFIWILPERRKNLERITKESILNLGKRVVFDDKEAKDIFFVQVEIDETQIESSGSIPISELRKKFEK